MPSDRPDRRRPGIPSEDLPPVQAVEDIDQEVSDRHVERVRPGAIEPDPTDRPDGGNAPSLPMLLEERTDALSAMGISPAIVWANLAPMLAWGAIVLGLFTLSVPTGG